MFFGFFSNSRSVRLEAWDVFRDIPEDPSQGRNDQLYGFWMKVFKVITIIVTFVFVLGCALISKGTLLFVTSQIRQNITLLCNSYTSDDPTLGGTNNTQCVLLPDGFYSHFNQNNTNISGIDVSSALTQSLTCLASDSIVDDVFTTVVSSRRTMCSSVTVRWLWCLLLIMVTPYFFVFLRSAWNCCFKTKKNPTLDAFFLVSTSLSIILLYTLFLSACVFLITLMPTLKYKGFESG